MISDRALIAGLFAVALLLVAIRFADDGMAACQLNHSFDVCHDAIH